MARRKGKKVSLIIASLVFFLFLICLQEGNTFARETIAKLSKFEGEVELVREGKTIPVKLNMPILSGDRIQTKIGLAEVEFLDGSLLKIRPNSDMMVEQGMKKRKVMGVWTKEYLARMVKLQKGEVFGDIKYRKDLTTEFESPSVVVAVRGSTLTFGTDPATGETTINIDVAVVDAYTIDGWTVMRLTTGDIIGVRVDPATGVASVYCYAGSVEVTSAGVTVTVSKGEGTTVEPGKPPAPPAPAAPPTPPPPPPPPPPPVPPASPSE